MKILLVYFSATNNTARMAEKIGQLFRELGAEVEKQDITSHEDRQEGMDLKPYDAVVFGFPIHSWRAPRIVRQWLKTLDGGGRKCSMFFTYGGFKIHPSHYSTKAILEGQGFVVVSSADFPAPHTYNLGGWRAMMERPDESDFLVAREYVERTFRRFTGEDTEILGDLEKTEFSEEHLDGIENFRFRIVTRLPTRDGRECGMCMACEELCPTGAMDAESGRADREKCIVCLRCLAGCPEDALEINDMSESWTMKLHMENATEESLKAGKSSIYL
jgi:ferredoxin/flavodoxin